MKRVFVHDAIRVDGARDRVAPDRWRPLLMSFQELYGLGGKRRESAPAGAPEDLYRGPDIARSRAAPAASGRS